MTDTTKAGGMPTNLFVAIAFAAPPSTPKAGSASTPTPGVPTKDQLAAAKAVQAYLGITEKDITAGTDTFQTSVSSVPVAGTGGDRSVPGFVPASSLAKGSSSGPIPAVVTSHLREGAAVAGALVLLFLVRRSLRRRQALLGSAEARWMPTLAAPPIPVDDIALPAGPSHHELEAANKKALQGRVEEIAGQRPSDVAQQLRGWLAEDS